MRQRRRRLTLRELGASDEAYLRASVHGVTVTEVSYSYDDGKPVRTPKIWKLRPTEQLLNCFLRGGERLYAVRPGAPWCRISDIDTLFTYAADPDVELLCYLRGGVE